MLSRAANALFWMSRHIERAENLARVMDVRYQMSMRPGGAGNNLLLAPLEMTGTRARFCQMGFSLSPDDVMYFFALHPENPSSIYSLIYQARENALSVRGKMTTDMWECLNATWLEIKDMDQAALAQMTPLRFLEWVKERSHLFRGATFGTIRRSEVFHFCRLGTFMERADNTARLVLLNLPYMAANSEEGEISALEYDYLVALLRCLSASEAYQDLYRERICAKQVTQILLVRDDLPRSLLSCVQELVHVLDCIGGAEDAKKLAAQIMLSLNNVSQAPPAQQELKIFLQRFISDIHQLSVDIKSTYLEHL